jgi:hypothetical protein
LPGLHIDLLAGGGIEICREPPFSPTCQVSTSWLQDLQTVNDDLFMGQQFTRRQRQGSDNTGADTPALPP